MNGVRQHTSVSPIPLQRCPAVVRGAAGLGYGSERAFGPSTGRGRRILVVVQGLEALWWGWRTPGRSRLTVRSLRGKRRVALLATVDSRAGGLSRVPSIRCVVADVATWHEGSFDIIASNVLHHHQPGVLFERLASCCDRGLRV